MISPIGFSEVFGGYQGVDLGGGYIGMAQHGLNGTKVGPAFKQMGSKGMPQGMRGNCFGDPRLPAVFTEDLPKSLPGYPGPAVVHKDPG